MSSPGVELYRAARRVLRTDPALTDEQVAELCGLTPLVRRQFGRGLTHEEIAIASARREVSQDLDAETARKVQQRALDSWSTIGEINSHG